MSQEIQACGRRGHGFCRGCPGWENQLEGWGFAGCVDGSHGFDTQVAVELALQAQDPIREYLSKTAIPAKHFHEGMLSGAVVYRPVGRAKVIPTRQLCKAGGHDTYKNHPFVWQLPEQIGENGRDAVLPIEELSGLERSSLRVVVDDLTHVEYGRIKDVKGIIAHNERIAIAGGSEEEWIRRAFSEGMTGTYQLLSMTYGEMPGPIVAPLRAGLEAALADGRIAKEFQYDPQNVLTPDGKDLVPETGVVLVDAKRLQVNGSNEFAVGIDNGGFLVTDGRLNITDCCMATGISTLVILASQQVMGAQVEQMTVRSAAVTTQAVRQLSTYCVEQGVGLEIQTLAVYDTLDKNGYIRKSNGDMAVNDAGDRSLPIGNTFGWDQNLVFANKVKSSVLGNNGYSLD